MQIWMNLVLVLQLLAALGMIGLVLVQHGKGADMGASFGSGASGSLFGASGSANFLSRSTAICAAVFFICTLAMAYFNSGDNARAPAASANTSVLDRVAPAASAASAPGGAAIPSVVAPAASQAAPATAASAGAIPAK